MGLLSKEAILKASDLPTGDVDCPEIGGSVRLRMLTGAERDAWETSVAGDGDKPRNTANIRARLVAMSAADETGKRLFTDAEAVQLGAVRSDVLDRLFDAALALSKLRRKDVEAEKKPLSGDPSAASSSDSAFPSAVPTPTSCLAS